MTLPSGRILTCTVPLDGCPVDDTLDPASYPRRRLDLVAPYRIEHAEHQSGINLLNGQLADGGMGIVAQRIRPLLGMFAPPASPMGFYVSRSTSRKTDSLRRL